MKIRKIVVLLLVVLVSMYGVLYDLAYRYVGRTYNPIPSMAVQVLFPIIVAVLIHFYRVDEYSRIEKLVLMVCIILACGISWYIIWNIPIYGILMLGYIMIDLIIKDVLKMRVE